MIEKSADYKAGFSATTQTGVLHWYVDASFAVYQDMRGQTGGALALGCGCHTVQTTKAKCSTRSSTIQELVAVMK